MLWIMERTIQNNQSWSPLASNFGKLDNITICTNSIRTCGHFKSKESTTTFEEAMCIYANRNPKSIECRSETVYEFYPKRDFEGSTFC